MGAVHRATDTRTGQEVALKLLHSVDERARRRLALEVRALARLRHEQLIALLDAGEEHGAPWLAMELVRGRSLQERLDREGVLAPREAALLVRDLALAVEHAHGQGVLHRDIKPDNVLLPADGGPPRLTDFGLAGFRFDLSQSRLSASGVLLGTPGYWAPEQARGDAGSFGPHTDVYGLGALLHACLTGRPPFEGESLPEVLVATAQRRPSPSGADPALDALALRCLAKAPGDRPASAAAVARDLTRYLAGGSPRRSARRGARSLGARLGLMLATVGAIATLAVVARHASSPGGGTAVSELLARASARERDGDPRAALLCYDAVLELDPRHFVALVNRGSARRELGDLRGALADLDAALAVDPRHPQALVNRSAVKEGLDDLQGALADHDAALAVDPRHVRALPFRGPRDRPPLRRGPRQPRRLQGEARRPAGRPLGLRRGHAPGPRHAGGGPRPEGGRARPRPAHRRVTDRRAAGHTSRFRASAACASM